MYLRVLTETSSFHRADWLGLPVTPRPAEPKLDAELPVHQSLMRLGDRTPRWPDGAKKYPFASAKQKVKANKTASKKE